MDRVIDRLDDFSLLVALWFVYAGSLAFSLVLFLVRRRFPGSRFWLAGQLLFSFSVALTLAHAMGAAYDYLVAANAALLASILVQGHALWAFSENRPFPVVLYGAVLAVFPAWFALGGLTGRIIVISGLIGAAALWNASVVIRMKGRGYRSASLAMACYFATIALAAFGRVFMTLRGRLPISLENEGRLSVPSCLFGIGIAFFNLFGYFLLSAVRSENELKHAGDALAERNMQLARLVSLKDSLINVLGHDLRAPLSSASGYARKHLLAYQGDLNDKRESLAALCEGLDRSARLLDNLVEWARSESGKLELKAELISLAYAAREAAKDVSSMAEAKGIRLELPASDVNAYADPRAVITVFRNLLSNAIKYSHPRGTVRVSLSSGHWRRADRNSTRLN